MTISHESPIKPLLKSALLVGAIATAGILAISHFNLLDFIFFWRGRAETITVEQMVGIREMVAQKEYGQANQILDEYHHASVVDATAEYKVYDAYRAFQITPDNLEGKLLAWRDATPDAYQPYLALSQYYYAKGWESRGFKIARETSKARFDEMQSYFAKSMENLGKALQLESTLFLAYYTQIGIRNAGRIFGDEDEIIEEALQRYPHSFLICSVALWAKEPRWGGSYEQMLKLAENAQQYSRANPKMKALYGLIYAYQARIMAKNERYEDAFKLYNHALATGEHWSFHYGKARIYHFDLKDYEKALGLVNKSMTLRPTIADNYRLRSRIHFARGDLPRSLEDLTTAELLKPGDADNKTWMEWASKNVMNRGHRVFKTDKKAAIGEYDLSIKFNLEGFEPYYWKGVAHYRLKEDEAAADAFKQAIALNPEHFESCRMLDYTLAKSARWGEILQYWDAFLERVPDHAEAYFERSGTHYHNKELDEAIADLKRACELGHQKACDRYRSMSQ